MKYLRLILFLGLVAIADVAGCSSAAPKCKGWYLDYDRSWHCREYEAPKPYSGDGAE